MTSIFGAEEQAKQETRSRQKTELLTSVGLLLALLFNFKDGGDMFL
jgi:hypothetical protein